MNLRPAIIFCASFLAFLMFIPSIMIGIFGGYKDRTAFSIPINSDFKIDVIKRYSFPSFELADASIIVKFQVVETASSRLLSTSSIDIYEDSDLMRPEIKIKDKNIYIFKFDESDLTKTIVMPLP